VLLYLAEEDIASAWALAEGKPLTLVTWRHFAPRIEDNRPESALRAYRALTEAAAAQTSKQGYAEARDCCAACNRCTSASAAATTSPATSPRSVPPTAPSAA
jgi:hypothetical protein